MPGRFICRAFLILTGYLDNLPREYVPGCDMIVWVERRPVYRHFTSERGPGKPMTGTEIYWLYSAAKALTMQLVESFAEKPLHFDLGSGYRYSLCHDVIGAALEVATSKPLSALVQEQVFEPLGIRNMSFHPKRGQLRQMVAEYGLAEDGRLIPATDRPNLVGVFPHCDSGGGGLMGDVDSYILLADALANDGVGANGVRILTRASIDDMRTNRQHGACMNDFRKVLHKRGYGYALGVRTLIDPTTSKSPVGEFGWDGAAGAWTMMDADRHIAAFYAQHVLGCNRAFYEYHPSIRDLIYEGLDA